MDVGITDTWLMQQYQPVQIRGQWRVHIGDKPRFFATEKEAKKFLTSLIANSKPCLYGHCRQYGLPMPGMGKGFVFCRTHMQRAYKALTTQR